MPHLTSKSHMPRTMTRNPAERSADPLSGRAATHDAIDLKPVTVTDPATMPERYIVRLDGDCLEPLVMNGAQVVIERDAKIACGDLVLLFFKPEHVPGGKYQTILKRVVMAPPPYVKFPYREHPDSEVHALVVVEMLNPHRTFAYKCEHLLGIHKCIGPVPADATAVQEQKALPVPVGAGMTGSEVEEPQHSPFLIAYAEWLRARSAMAILNATPIDDDEKNDAAVDTAIGILAAAEWKLLQTPATSLAEIRRRAMIVQEMFSEEIEACDPTDNRSRLMLATLVSEIRAPIPCWHGVEQTTV
jgi:hypothetical protein